ncbi:hypothetical protein K474DRAFT_1660934 [Panus rudis PR-1116 ss-1]|nr:hypothetical protein K474DRAFT_1660934 [Panus rudis PR-1116 ss-1]
MQPSIALALSVLAFIACTSGAPMPSPADLSMAIPPTVPESAPLLQGPADTRAHSDEEKPVHPRSTRPRRMRRHP